MLLRTYTFEESVCFQLFPSGSCSPPFFSSSSSLSSSFLLLLSFLVFVSSHSLPKGPSTYNGLSSFSSTTGHFYVNSPLNCQKGCELKIVKIGVRSYFNNPYQRGGGRFEYFSGVWGVGQTVICYTSLCLKVQLLVFDIDT